MTRDDFEAFMDGPQWTGRDLERLRYLRTFRQFTPCVDATESGFRGLDREMWRSDGMIEVKPFRLRRRPWIIRFYWHFRAHWKAGVPFWRSVRYARDLARL